MKRRFAFVLAVVAIVFTGSDVRLARSLTCTGTVSAFQGCTTGCFPSQNFSPPSVINLAPTFVSGSSSGTQLDTFRQRLQEAADGWEDFLSGYNVTVQINVQTSPDSSTTHPVEISDQIVDGQGFSGTQPGGATGRIGAPLEWLTSTALAQDYIKSVLAHEMGHLLGYQQVPCPGSIMSNTTSADYRWFTGCDHAHALWYFYYGAPVCYLEPPCGQDEYLGSDGCCYNQQGSPILLSLDHNKFSLSGPRYGVSFDIFGTGLPFRVGWPIDPAINAWLALDRNGDGRITSGRELFGDATLLENGERASNGFVALAEYDDNGDGKIDSRDAVFGQLRLWTDVERDGIGISEELHSLISFGIIAIELDYRETRRQDVHGNAFRYRAKVSASQPPKTRLAFDVYLAVLPINSR